jgi:hypothetical protein
MKKTTKSLYKSQVNYTLDETKNKKIPLKRVIAGKKTFFTEIDINLPNFTKNYHF